MRCKKDQQDCRRGRDWGTLNWWHSFSIPFKWMNLASLPICRITAGERVPLDCSFSFCRIWSWWLCCHPGLVTLLSIYLSLLLVLLIVHDFCVWFHRCVVTLVILVQLSLCIILFLFCPMFFMCWKINQILKKLSRLWVLGFVGIVSTYACRSCSDGWWWWWWCDCPDCQQVGGVCKPLFLPWWGANGGSSLDKAPRLSISIVI